MVLHIMGYGKAGEKVPKKFHVTPNLTTVAIRHICVPQGRVVQSWVKITQG